MPYEGISVSLEEMLETLVRNNRTEAAAALELEHAIEDGRISLLLPDGTNDAGETLYSKMSPLARSHVITVLRMFPNRMRVPSIAHANVPVEMIMAARATRIEFETACTLRAVTTQAAPPLAKHVRQVGDDALVEEALVGLTAGLWPNVHQAAIALAEKGIGASGPAIIRRLEGKISKRLETIRKTSKH